MADLISDTLYESIVCAVILSRMAGIDVKISGWTEQEILSALRDTRTLWRSFLGYVTRSSRCLFRNTVNRYFAVTGGDASASNPKLSATTPFTSTHTLYSKTAIR